MGNGQLWVQFPLEATLFFKDTSMLILYKNVRNVIIYEKLKCLCPFWRPNIQMMFS